MKLIIDENIVIFLDKIYLQTIDLTNQNQIQKKLIKLINKLQNRYTLDLNGYYSVFIYKDENYGLIIDMQKEELEYLDYFNNQIEMSTQIIEDTFLYKIEDIFRLNKNLLKKFIMYKNKEKIYLKAKDTLTHIELGIILENGEIIYGKNARKIETQSQIISR